MVYLFIKILISLQDIHESESEVAQSCPTLCDPWTVAHQVPLSMGFSRKEYWSGLPFPSPGDLPNPGIESGSPTLQADALTSDPPGKPQNTYTQQILRFTHLNEEFQRIARREKKPSSVINAKK